MLRSILLATLVASPAAAQVSTDCYSALGGTHCQTQPATPNVGQSMIDRMQDDTARMNAEASRASSERRTAAYDRVGEMISKGDCEGAKKLARFYNHKDIIADTDRACR